MKLQDTTVILRHEYYFEYFVSRYFTYESVCYGSWRQYFEYFIGSKYNENISYNNILTEICVTISERLFLAVESGAVHYENIVYLRRLYLHLEAVNNAP